MLYTIVMVSAINQHEAATDIHISLPFEPPSYLPLHPTPLGCHRAPDLGFLHHTANSHWLSILHMVIYMFQCLIVLESRQFRKEHAFWKPDSITKMGKANQLCH